MQMQIAVSCFGLIGASQRRFGDLQDLGGERVADPRLVKEWLPVSCKSESGQQLAVASLCIADPGEPNHNALSSFAPS